MTAISLSSLSRRAQVTAKLAGMRKAQTFSVYPRRAGESVMVQSDRAIGQFDPVTGVGRLNWKGNGRKYGVHLSASLGAEPFTFPADFVAECRAVDEGEVHTKPVRMVCTNTVALTAEPGERHYEFGTGANGTFGIVEVPAPTPSPEPMRADVALLKVARIVEAGTDSAGGADDILRLLVQVGASAGVRFRALEALRAVCLGSPGPGNLSGYLGTVDRWQFTAKLEEASRWMLCGGAL